MIRKYVACCGSLLAVTVATAEGCPEGAACEQGQCCASQTSQVEALGNGVYMLTGSFEAPLVAALPASFDWKPAQQFAFASTAEDTVQVVISGDDVRVIRNGQKVPPDRIRRDGDKLCVLDENGEVACEIEVGPGDAKGAWQVAASSLGQPAERPPVMMGITMGEPDDALRAHLGIGDRKVIMLDGVIDGLPAAEAGLKKFDIILAIDGSDDNITPDHLHKVLMGKNPGEELKLRVMRGNMKETYTLKLKAYDADALSLSEGDEEANELIDLMPHIVAPTAPTAPQVPSAKIEELMSQLRGHGLNDEQIDSVHKALKQALTDARRVEVLRGPEGNFIFQGPGGQQRMIEIPQGWQSIPDVRMLQERAERLAPDRDALEARLSQLEKRLDEMSGRLDERLERVLKHVEELTNRLERRMRDDG